MHFESIKMLPPSLTLFLEQFFFVILFKNRAQNQKKNNQQCQLWFVWFCVCPSLFRVTFCIFDSFGMELIKLSKALA